jgi:hypothetical protein
LRPDAAASEQEIARIEIVLTDGLLGGDIDDGWNRALGDAAEIGQRLYAADRRRAFTFRAGVDGRFCAPASFASRIRPVSTMLAANAMPPASRRKAICVS